jgi:hypothetical protein
MLESRQSPSSSASGDIDPVPRDPVRLILLYDPETSLSFYLEIPLETINFLCFKPRKYLIFLGWWHVVR